MLLTIDGVWLATRGYADGVHKEGFQPLKEIIGSSRERRPDLGLRRVHEAARHYRGHFIPGARIVTAAMVVEAMVNGASALAF